MILKAAATNPKAGSSSSSLKCLQRLTRVAAVQMSRSLISNLAANPETLSYLLKEGFLNLEMIYNMVVNLVMVAETCDTPAISQMTGQLMKALNQIVCTDPVARKSLLTCAVGKLVRAALGENACRASDQSTGNTR